MIQDGGFPYPRGTDPASLGLWARQVVDRLNGVRRADSEALATLESTVGDIESTTTAQQGQIDDLFTTVGTLGDNALTPQQLFELQLTTASNEVFGASQAIVDDALRWAQAQSEAAIRQAVQSYRNRAGIFVEQQVRQTETLSLASQVATLTADLSSVSATVSTNQLAVAGQITSLLSEDAVLAAAITSGDATNAAAIAAGDAANAAAIAAGDATNAAAITAVASTVSTVQTQVSGNTAAISTVQTSLGGTQARWGVVINLNGQVTGLVRLDGSQTGSTFTVVADKFVVAHPSSPGTTQVVFVAGTINGVSGVGINGDVLIDGSVLARHLAVSSLSAITANLGTVTAGLIRNSADTIRFDLPNMRIYRTDGKMDLDFENLFFEITATS